jgi:hypothetical protein
MVKTHSTLFVAFLGAALSLHSAVNLTFSEETLTNQANGYIGGWYGNNIAFEQWTGNSASISIAGGVLTANSDSGFKTAAFVIESSAMDGAGNYELSFDVPRIESTPNNNGYVSIWSGSGYNLSGSADALFINTELASVVPQGNAVASKLVDTSFQETGSNIVNFTYDGSSALVFMLGAQTNGYPFPSVDYDNFSVQKLTTVPEPAIWLWLVPFVAFVLIQRRPRAD